MNLSALYKHIKQTLADSGIETADLDARIILQNVTGHEWSDIIARGEAAVPVQALNIIEEHIVRRKNGEPVSRIYGTRQFWGLEFNISKDTLDPRPDSETLVEKVLERFKGAPPQTILDMGTGSGCLLLALLSEFRDAQGIGIDLSLGALEKAKENAVAHNLSDRAHFFCGCWGESLGRKFDLIVSNPPYIPNQDIESLSKEVRNHDPILALNGGEDGLQAYKIILKDISSHLNPDGYVFFEIGYDQAHDVTRLVEDAGFVVEAVHADLAGNPRVVEISSGDK